MMQKNDVFNSLLIENYKIKEKKILSDSIDKGRWTWLLTHFHYTTINSDHYKKEWNWTTINPQKDEMILQLPPNSSLQTISNKFNDIILEGKCSTPSANENWADPDYIPKRRNTSSKRIFSTLRKSSSRKTQTRISANQLALLESGEYLQRSKILKQFGLHNNSPIRQVVNKAKGMYNKKKKKIHTWWCNLFTLFLLVFLSTYGEWNGTRNHSQNDQVLDCSSTKAEPCSWLPFVWKIDCSNLLIGLRNICRRNE